MSLLSPIAPFHFGPLALLADAPPLVWWQWVAMLAVKVGILIGGGLVVKSFLTRLVEAMRGKPPGVDSVSAGLGGGLGGWRMTPSAVWLLLTVSALVLFTAVALQLSDGLVPPPPKPEPPGASDEKNAKPESKGSEATGQAKKSDSTASDNTKKANEATGRSED